MKKSYICKQFLEFINEEFFKSQNYIYFSAKIFLFILEMSFTFFKLKLLT